MLVNNYFQQLPHFLLFCLGLILAEYASQYNIDIMVENMIGAHELCLTIEEMKYLQEKGNIVECVCAKTGFWFDELKNKFVG